MQVFMPLLRSIEATLVKYTFPGLLGGSSPINVHDVNSASTGAMTKDIRLVPFALGKLKEIEHQTLASKQTRHCPSADDVLLSTSSTTLGAFRAFGAGRYLQKLCKTKGDGIPRLLCKVPHRQVPRKPTKMNRGIDKRCPVRHHWNVIDTLSH
jgi:hypothetical protein